MPEIDDGPTDGPPGKRLRAVWVRLSHTEALQLLESLKVWADELQAGHTDPGWHTHIDDAEGNTLAIAIKL